MSGPGSSTTVSRRGRTVNVVPNDAATCPCGASFRIFTDPPKGEKHPAWHCQCPPCEAEAVRVAVLLAWEMRATDFGSFLFRVAS